MKLNPSPLSQIPRSQRGRDRRPLFVMVCLSAVSAGVAFWLWDSPGPPAISLSSLSSAPAGVAVVERREVNARRVVPSSESGLDNPRAAQLAFDGTRRVVAPNVRGEFPRVSVPGAAVIRATVPFPGVAPGQTIFLQAEDGGALQGAASGGHGLSFCRPG